MFSTWPTDDDPDIVLGAANRMPYAVGPSIESFWKEKGPSLLILRNERTPPPSQASPDLP